MIRRKRKVNNDESIASIEVFGGVFALLLVLYVIMNIFSSSRLEERLDELSNNGEYKISWGEHGDGYVVLAYPDSIFIIENGNFIPHNNICKKGSSFYRYATSVYEGDQKQIIFAILDNGVETMRIARDCLQSIYPKKKVSIGWMIIDDQTMKSIKINDIPYYLEE